MIRMDWRTGSSKHSWILRGAGKCEEARRFLLERCECEGGDAEAEWEMSTIWADGHLGFNLDREMSNKHVERASKLGHPTALFYQAWDVPPEDQLLFLQDLFSVGDHYTRAQIRKYDGEDGYVDMMQELVLGMAEGEVLCYVVYADMICAKAPLSTTLFDYPYARAAKLGHPYSCQKHALHLLGTEAQATHFFPLSYPVDGAPRPDAPFSEAMRFLEIGAAQGDYWCRLEIVRMRFCIPQTMNFRRAALMIVDMTHDERQRKLIDIRCAVINASRLLIAVEVHSEKLRVQTCSEAYVYGKYYFQLHRGKLGKSLALECRESGESFRNCQFLCRIYYRVCASASAAVIALWGVLFKRVPNFHRDIAVMLCKVVWSSRETQTEVWK